MFNFPTWIPDCASHSAALLDLYLLRLVFDLQWLFLHWEFLIMFLLIMLLLYSIDFPTNSIRDVAFHRIFSDYYPADWDGLRDVLWEDIFKLSISAAASEFCGWHQVGIDVYNTHRKYQFNLHSSPWFLAAHAAVIVHRNHFFCL